MARVALLACAGGLAFVVCASGGFLLLYLAAYVFLARLLQRDAVVGHA